MYFITPENHKNVISYTTLALRYVSDHAVQFNKWRPITLLSQVFIKYTNFIAYSSHQLHPRQYPTSTPLR